MANNPYPTMPDTEAGQILKSLYAGSGPASASRSTPHSHLHLQNQQGHEQMRPIPGPAYPRTQSQETSVTPPDPLALLTPAPAKRSRSRPTKSCEQCRKKKLKCNRELPCSNCLKGGRDGRMCHFEYGPEGGERHGFGKDEGIERGMKRFRVDVDDHNHNPHNQLPPLAQQGYEIVQRPMAPMYPPSNHHYVPDDAARNNHVEQERQSRSFGSYATAYPTPASIPGSGSGPPPTHPVSEQAPRSYPASTLGHVHVKGSGSRYVGVNDKWALFDHFEDCKELIMGGFRDSDMSPIFHELSAFHKAFHPRHPKCKTKDDESQDRDALLVDMLNEIPPEHMLATAQQNYVATWETIFRVLHQGTFAKNCLEISTLKATGATSLPPHIKDWVLPQILCVISTASRLFDPSDRASAADKIPEEQIAKNLMMVQKWLDGIRGKSQMNINILQTRTLLLLARQANLAHPSELWRQSGDLVRRAMTMGLHQDPENFDRMSKFDKEMRRKLWMTIVELDMRFSLSKGFPTAVSSSLIDMNEIMNVDDEELTEEMQQDPISKHNTIWTHALPQIALGASLRERLDATNILGGLLNLERDAPSLLQHARVLERALRLLPTQFRSSTKTGNNNNKRAYRLFTSIMLDVSIRRPLLALYRTIALSPVSEQYPEARTGALRNSLAILAHLDALDPAVADLSIVKSRDYLNLFHILCKTDIMQAAMILCYQIRSFNNSSRSSESADEGIATNEPDERIQEEAFPQTKQSLTRLVENTLNSMMQRLGEFGSDLKEVVPLSVLLQGVRADGTDAEKKAMMIKGAERVLIACRKILPGIQDVVQQNNMCRGVPCGQGLMENLPVRDWAPPNLQNTGPMGNGALPTFNDFNLMAGDDLMSQNFDFGFSDWSWDLNQSWS